MLMEQSFLWRIDDEAEFFKKWGQLLGDIRARHQRTQCSYRARNLDKVRKYHRLHMKAERARDPSKSRAILRKSYYKHQAKRIEGARLARLKRKSDETKLNAYREYCRVTRRHREKTDIHFRLMRRLRGRIVMSLARGICKSGPTVELIGCTIPAFKVHIESLWTAGMSWENYGKGDGKWQIDHVKPCKSFDLSDPVQQRQCFHFTNTQPLWEKDNLSKGSKH